MMSPVSKALRACVQQRRNLMRTAKTLVALVLLTAVGGAWACNVPGMVHNSDAKKPAIEQSVNPSSPATSAEKKN